MSAPANSSAEAAPSSSGGLAGIAPTSPARTPVAASADSALPVVGACWREKYQIVEQVPAATGTLIWRGQVVEGGQEVVLRASQPTEPEIRAQAWAKLGGIDSPALQHPRDAHRAREWRVEVADAPRGVPLHVWRAGQANVDLRILRMVVGQLAEALAALHAFELVHLDLRPDTIFVEERGLDVQCMIAGLDALTSFDRKEPLPAAVDPFYSPPEALGLNVHVPGPGICAWDWWSLGRVIQEFVLGRHIVGQLANVDTRPVTPELRSRAEALLLEAEKTGPRAGAVELMTGLDPQIGLLLRGLLTSASEARWTGDNIDRWVRGLPVKEHYATPRADTHFRWRGRPCTVPEIAAILQSAEHWPENSVQLFEPTTPGTLAHFLRWSATTQATAHDQLVSALELADALPLKLSSSTAQREAVTMVALLQLSTTKLVWRGKSFESTTVAAILNELGETDGLMVLRALSTRSTALQIERVDAAAGRLLTELGRTVGDAEGTLRRFGWQGATDPAGSARLFRLALEPLATLRAVHASLAQSFAGSDLAPMEKLFKAQSSGRVELVVLAWAAASPERFKFFTHAEAARRRAEALRARGGELTAALTWVQFEGALGVGRIVFGGWGWFILTWLAVGAGMLVLWPGPIGVACAVAPAGLAFALRFLAAPRIARALCACIPETAWSWRDGPVRCQRELRLAGHGQPPEVLESELVSVKKELATLDHVQPSPPPLPELPRFGGVRLAGLMSWVLLAACVGVGGWRTWAHPPSIKQLRAGWAPPAAAAKPAVAPVVVTGNATEEKKEDIKVSWPYRPGDTASKLTVRLAREATSAQVAYATKHGRELVAPYLPETINTWIVMPVPGNDDEATVMIFDGKSGGLLNQQAYVLEFRPIPRTAVELSGHRGIYLDQ